MYLYLYLELDSIALHVWNISPRLIPFFARRTAGHLKLITIWGGGERGGATRWASAAKHTNKYQAYNPFYIGSKQTSKDGGNGGRFKNCVGTKTDARHENLQLSDTENHPN